MNNEQMNAAKEQMISWLSHPSELGKEPSKIECAGSFELYDMTYYIFKYKKSMFGKWLLGVAGGYEGDSLENCGHTFSEMEEYNEATAKDDAVKMVEMIRKYWMDMAERAQEHENEKGTLELPEHYAFMIPREVKDFFERMRGNRGDDGR